MGILSEGTVLCGDGCTLCGKTDSSRVQGSWDLHWLPSNRMKTFLKTLKSLKVQPEYTRAL